MMWQRLPAIKGRAFWRRSNLVINGRVLGEEPKVLSKFTGSCSSERLKVQLKIAEKLQPGSEKLEKLKKLKKCQISFCFCWKSFSWIVWLFITGRFPTKKRRWQSDVLIKFHLPNELSPENYQLIYEPSIDFSLIQPESQRLRKIFSQEKNNYFTRKAFLFVPVNLEDSRGKFKFFSSHRIATQHSNRIKRAANSRSKQKLR